MQALSQLSYNPNSPRRYQSYLWQRRRMIGITRFAVNPKIRLCPNYVLHGAPQRLMQTCFDIYAFSVTLQHPAPTQVVLQVVRRHAMEPLHPLLQPTVISVYMLDVVRANHTLALTIAHDLMGHSLRFAETGIHPGAIATQHRI